MSYFNLCSQQQKKFKANSTSAPWTESKNQTQLVWIQIIFLSNDGNYKKTGSKHFFFHYYFY
jgi:hypothetical protein